jgi:hypothetical protein
MKTNHKKNRYEKFLFVSVNDMLFIHGLLV